MNWTLESVEPRRIDSSFDRFSCSWPAQSTVIEKSIARIGLISPPLLTTRGGRYVTVCGLRRIKAATKLSLSEVTCRVVDGEGRSDADFLAMNLEDNLTTRRLGIFEKARLLDLLDAFDGASRQAVIDRFGPALEIRGDDHEAARFASLHALGDDVKDFIARKNMPQRQALRVAGLGPVTAASLLTLAETYSLTAAQAGEAAELTGEIMRRDERSFDDLARALAEEFDTTSLSRNQLRDALVDRLREMRFPIWKERAAAMKSCLDKINGTPGVSVHGPPNFEGDAFSARMTFHSAEELAERARALEAFAGSEAARQAFGLL